MSDFEKIVVSTNIGTYNHGNRIKLHDELTLIEQTWGKINFLLLQELNKKEGILNTASLPPFFDTPKHNDATNDSTVRGVGTFGPDATDENAEIELEVQKLIDELENEFVIRIFDATYRSRGRKAESKIALVNAYGNHTKKEQVKIQDELRKIIECCKLNLVKNMIISGDMNDENVELEGFHELRHPKLFHQDRVGAQRTNIDKVLCNFDKVKILEIRTSLESKSSGNENLGHKVIVFSINGSPEPAEIKSLNYGRFWQIYQERKPILKNIKWNWVEIDKAHQENDQERCEELLDIAGEKLYDYLGDLVDRATTTKLTRNRSKHATLAKATESLDENMKDQKKAKSLFTIAKNIKNGIERTNESLPELSKFVDKLEEKLKKLESVNQRVYDRLIGECYTGTEITEPEIVERLKFPEKKEFEKIMLSVNKSGASDYAGVTTKASSLLFQKCKTFRDILFNFFKRTSATGHISRALKIDKVVFLWKRKGSILDVANYRPITHAPAIGKHFEKLTKTLLNKVPDGNHENHAYTQQMSIFTAITELINIIQEINRMNEDLEDKTKVIIPILIAEDISGAFECLPHVSLGKCVHRMHELHKVDPENYKNIECKVDKLTLSYLDRNAAVHSDSGEKVPIELIRGRSSPQGSSNSPKFWRIHDRIFSKLHHENMKELLLTNKDILLYKHVGFADDHVTCIALLVEKTTEKNVDQFLENTKKINKAVIQTRLSLNSATTTTGSKINAAKTEIVCADTYSNYITQAANHFKWLGYTFELSKTYKLTISDKQIDSKIAASKKCLNDIFSYFAAPDQRLKIYKIYLNPMIDFFLLQFIVNNKQNELQETDKVSKFQHYCLTRVLQTYPEALKKQEIQNALQELSVPQKATRLAAQLSNCPRVAEIQKRHLDELNNAEVITITTRGNQITTTNSNLTANNCLPLKLLKLSKQHSKLRKASASKEKINEIAKLASKLRHNRIQCFGTTHVSEPELWELRNASEIKLSTIWPASFSRTDTQPIYCEITSLRSQVHP